jgi:pyrroloquinoline quinone (PQQ) biosynthesis protein C
LSKPELLSTDHETDVDAPTRRRRLPTNLDEFWELTANARLVATHLADTNVRRLEQADLPTLRAILVQYRWFTAYFPGDLGLLIQKMPPSRMRTFLGEILHEELGSGDPAQAHLALYDNFLETLGITQAEAEESANPHSIALLEMIRHRLINGGYAFGIGLRGMGGECLCQVYLESINHYLFRNKEVQRMLPQLDVTFWDIHAGEADQAHASKTREYIEEMCNTEDQIRQCSLGYLDAERMWKVFWENAYATYSQMDRLGFGRRRDGYQLIPCPSDGLRFDKR